MKFYCGISITPIRKEASDRSEMVSELIFGETFTVLDGKENWLYIKLELDSYMGWIDSRAAMELDETQVYSLMVDDLYIKLFNKTGAFILNYGAEIFLNSEQITTVNGKFELPKKFLRKRRAFGDYKKKILEDAHAFINIPYLWGGRSSFGIDCSGLIQIIHKVNGIVLPRDAADQATVGTEVKFAERKAGDLAFFMNDHGTITHVGILSVKNKIIHSSGWVRKDNFTSKGIIPDGQDKLSHKLAFIRRILTRPE